MLIKDGENGFLVPVDNANEMAKRIRELIENEELQRSFSEEEIKINEKYNSAKIAEEWINYIIK